MKKLFFFIVAVLSCASAISQVDSVTYGISVTAPEPGIYLSRINVADGSVEKISADSVDQLPAGNCRTIDPLHHVFYYASDSGLLAFDLKTGELIRKITIKNYFNSTIRGMNYNYTDSTLYGVAVDAAGMNIRLAKLDPFTGTVTLLSGSSLATSYSALTGTALDPLHGIYYFETIGNPANHLIGADLHSGALVSDVTIGIDSADRFGPMEYNCQDSTLYGLSGNFTQRRKLARIDPYNGTVTVISTYPVADTILNEQVTIDPFQKIFYFEAPDHTLRGVDITSGNLVSAPYITPLPGSYFTGFIFNHTCYFHASSAVAVKKIIPDLTLFPNPVSDKLTIRSSAPLFSVEILDYTGRTVITENGYGQKEIQADLTGFPEGIYMVRIHHESRNVSSRFVKALPCIQPRH
jgi:hypothetical protein